jgi:carbamoylphosphate synthase small subunit
MVTVGCPSFPEVTEGVLLKEGFVTSLEMETKLSEMRDNMSVMEYRMESWLIRIRDLDTAEMSHMQENMSNMQQQISNMQQQRALDRAEISNLQQQRTLDRAEMRAEMRAQMRAFTAELRSGFRNS